MFICEIFTIYRYDPNADVPGDTDTEQDRIIFIKSVAEFMVRICYLGQNNIFICVWPMLICL